LIFPFFFNRAGSANYGETLLVFFIDSETWKKADSGLKPLYTALYFEYSHARKKCGYGMLSEYKPSTGNFAHIDMWINEEKKT